MFLSSDVHGLHPHGAPGQEAEPEQSREGTRTGERHCQHERPERPRPQEEREKMLLRHRRQSRSPLNTKSKDDWENCALGDKCFVFQNADMNVRNCVVHSLLRQVTTQQSTGYTASLLVVKVTEAEGFGLLALTTCSSLEVT